MIVQHLGQRKSLAVLNDFNQAARVMATLPAVAKPTIVSSVSFDLKHAGQQINSDIL
jgi:hypothetical protein